MFYRLDSTRVTLREYWWGTRNPLVIFGWIAKWLRIRLPGSVDDPNVETLDPFRVPPARLPEDVRTRFRPLHDELAACGFHSPECYWVHDVVHQTDIYQVVYLHRSGRAFARIHFREWTMPKPPKRYLFTTFVSPFSDGTYLVTTSARPDMLAPPSCLVNRLIGAPPARLWESHQAKLQELELTRTLVNVRAPQELAEAVETHHAAARDFHVQRGVFVPMTPEEEAPAVAAASPGDEAGERPARNAAVLAEIERLQNKSQSWRNALLFLVVSVVLFVVLGAKLWPLEFVLLLLPILFLHESGHYLAMRAFDYRNVRMFFIPLFGAAVAGQHYNVPGWKKVIVSLAGPLPGILLGAVLGGLGLGLEIPLLVNAAVLTVIVNGFNLLPIVPLDGGWVVHTLFFSRHYLLDAGFRALAVATLLVGATLLGDRILFFFGLFMAMGLPMAFRMARVVQSLRGHVAAASSDARSIPPETADAIVDRLRESFRQPLTNTNLARLTMQVFEALNTRPPGWPATLGLGCVYAGSFFFALVSLAVFVVARAR
jgi:Zn-dependent protease